MLLGYKISLRTETNEDDPPTVLNFRDRMPSATDLGAIELLKINILIDK
jgi:hypothetical protein